MSRDGRAPHHGTDSSGDVDGVMAVGHVSGWVVLVTRGSVQDGEADVQDVLLKLSPERLLLEVRVTPTLQTLSQPPPVICVVQGSLPTLPSHPPPALLQGHHRGLPSFKNPPSKSYQEPYAQPESPFSP